MLIISPTTSKGREMEQPTKYLSLRDLSKHSSLSVKTLRGFLYDVENPLPHYRMQRKILINLEEFERWFARFRIAHPTLNLDDVVNDLLDEL
jgi:hypothetical protein